MRGELGFGKSWGHVDDNALEFTPGHPLKRIGHYPMMVALNELRPNGLDESDEIILRRRSLDGGLMLLEKRKDFSLLIGREFMYPRNVALQLGTQHEQKMPRILLRGK